MTNCSNVYGCLSTHYFFRLCSYFINLGIIPGDGGAFFLQKLIGYQKAAELTLTGRKVSASEALELGLILKKVDPNQLLKEAKKFANEIAKKPKNTRRMNYFS